MGSEGKVLRLIRKWLIGILIFIIMNMLLTGISPIEFRDTDIKDEYYLTLIFATPLIVFLLIILDYLKNRKHRIFMLNFILGIPISIVALLIIGFLHVSFDSGRGRDNVLFKNRFYPSQKLVSRTSYPLSTPIKQSTHKITTLNHSFQWTIKADTTNVNLYRWIAPKNQTPN